MEKSIVKYTAPVAGGIPAGVDLWQLRWRDVPSDALGCLSAHERTRGAAFRREDDRRRFAATRAVLRHLLGQALGTDPAALVFCHNAHGKPALAGGRADAAPPSFNVSHAGEHALIALGHGCCVGVDIEAVDRAVDIGALAPLVLTDDERRALAAIQADGPARALFYTCWTAKEAFLKAVGIGIGDKLQAVSVQATATRQLRLATTDDVLAACIPRLEVMSVDVPQGYAAALAVMA